MLRCCACTEHMMRDQALVFCSHSASCADKGAVVESKVTGYWRASPMVENSALPDRHLSLRGLRMKDRSGENESDSEPCFCGPRRMKVI